VGHARLGNAGTGRTCALRASERLDTPHLAGKDITIHPVGVFEVNEGGKITNWRD
jgi:limonene-1,2-epoxide hydrolase